MSGLVAKLWAFSIAHKVPRCCICICQFGSLFQNSRCRNTHSLQSNTSFHYASFASHFRVLDSMGSLVCFYSSFSLLLTAITFAVIHLSEMRMENVTIVQIHPIRLKCGNDEAIEFCFQVSIKCSQFVWLVSNSRKRKGEKKDEFWQEEISTCV